MNAIAGIVLFDRWTNGVMNVDTETVRRLADSQLTAETVLIAVRLLARSNANGYGRLEWDEFEALVGASNHGAARRHLTRLKQASILTYRTNGFVEWTICAANDAPVAARNAPVAARNAPVAARNAPVAARGDADAESARAGSSALRAGSSASAVRDNQDGEKHAPVAARNAPVAARGDDESLLLLLLNNNNNKVVVEKNNNASAVDTAAAVEVVADVDESIQALLTEHGFVIASATVASWVQAHGAPHVAEAIRLAGKRKARHPERYISGIFSNWKEKGYPAVKQRPDFSRYAMDLTPPEIEMPEPERDPQPTVEGLPEDEPIDQSTWSKAKAELQLQLASSTYFTWLHDSWAVEQDDQCLTVAVASTYARDWLQHRLRSVVKRTVGNIVDCKMDVVFVVRPRPRWVE